MTLTRENSRSLASPSREDGECSTYCTDINKFENESLNLAELSTKMPVDSPMLNDNDSQNTLLRKHKPIMSSNFVRQGSFKRRDVASTRFTQKAKLRRTHSMFTNTKEVEINDSNIPIYESRLENSRIPIHFQEHNNDNLPRISVETLLHILSDEYKEFYQDVYIIDCRFEYEFSGGHIKNAINISKQKQLETEFIQKRHLRCSHVKKPPLVVFHCEFSSYRGPIMASHLRTCDRIINHDNYPKLHFPDVVVLDGGFKSFFEKYPNNCEGRYICMSSKNHDSELNEFKRDSKKLMTRANSTQIFHLKNKIDSIPVSFKDRIDMYGINDPHTLNSEELKPSSIPDSDFEDDEPYLNLDFNINAPPRLSLGRYGEKSPSNRSNSSKSSSMSTSSKLLFSDELATGYKLKCLEHDESDFDSDTYSFQFGDDDVDGRMGNMSSKKRLFPELLHASK
ncbi:unnamed protein product [Kluyveromyces dobzhanskii CBS 2104]|uniref:M-phase inducer phosphatase n=1 Tax=Kluyveromyces dobzhanskii CBS 2104 TaxID=1427455 RepID=A0A0A8LDQ3_9SACH|nr:unnamed protein product [Kluyveromyces dobzhanskii CBS 2104]